MSEADKPSFLPNSGEKGQDVAGFLAALVLSILIPILCLRLWKVDLGVPLCPYGDGFSTGLLIQGMMENGWYLQHPRAGAPGSCEWYNYPLSDALHFLIMKGIATLGCSWAATINFYFFLTFPLTTLSAYLVLRRFGRSRWASLTFGILYSFLPCHFYRGTAHLFLAGYYLVPLSIMVMLWLFQDAGLIRDKEGGLPGSRLDWRKFLASAIVCILVGSAGIYYAFFTCFFLAVTGLLAFAARRRFKAVLVSGVFIGLILLSILVNVLPNLLHIWKTEGSLAGLAEFRLPLESENYGLKLTPTLLPIHGHRLPWFRLLRQNYEGGMTPNETMLSTLGSFATAGFLILIVWLFLRGHFHRENQKLSEKGSDPLPSLMHLPHYPDKTGGLTPFRTASQNLDLLCLLNAAGVFLATVGGFGTLFACLVSSSIRCYNRISVFLAFFALFALAWCLEQLLARWSWMRERRGIPAVFFGLILFLGVLDLTPGGFSSGFLANCARNKVQYENEGRFIQEIEAQLPSGAMVFQLPYLAFPEVNPPGKMVDYDPLRGVLYSRSLRWSYGAWKKSPADQWQAYVSSLPLDKMVRTLVLVGFQGIYLDRFGYEDGGKELEIRLKNLSDTSPLVSSDNRFLFFNLRSYVEKLRNNYTAQEWEQQCQQAWWSPVNLSWGLGFSYEEKDAEFRWRWCCKPTTELIVANHSPETRSFVMKMRFAGLDSPPAQLIIDGPQIQAVESLPLEPGPELVSRLTLPQGKHVIRLKTSARGHRPPNDSRTLYFRLVNFELTELDEQGRVVSISR